MTTMSFDEFVARVFNTAGLEPATIAYQGTVPVIYQTDRGSLTSGQSIWCFAEREAAGQWAIDRYRTEELYLMARWITSAWGRNTTGEGRLQTEPAKDLFELVCPVLDSVCPRPTWSQANKFFQALNSSVLMHQGEYSETIDNVLSEYEYTYTYQAVKLRVLYRWLIENGLLDAAQS